MISARLRGGALSFFGGVFPPRTEFVWCVGTDNCLSVSIINTLRREKTSLRQADGQPCSHKPDVKFFERGMESRQRLQQSNNHKAILIVLTAKCPRVKKADGYTETRFERNKT